MRTAPSPHGLQSCKSWPACESICTNSILPDLIDAEIRNPPRASNLNDASQSFGQAGKTRMTGSRPGVGGSALQQRRYAMPRRCAAKPRSHSVAPAPSRSPFDYEKLAVHWVCRRHSGLQSDPGNNALTDIRCVPSSPPRWAAAKESLPLGRDPEMHRASHWNREQLFVACIHIRQIEIPLRQRIGIRQHAPSLCRGLESLHPNTWPVVIPPVLANRDYRLSVSREIVKQISPLCCADRRPHSESPPPESSPAADHATPTYPHPNRARPTPARCCWCDAGDISRRHRA